MEGQQKTGKLISVVKKMNGSIQDSWTSRDKTYYKNTLTFEKDGVQDIGTHNSLTPDGVYKVGEEYEYMKTTTGANNQYTNFKKLRLVNRQQGRGSYKKSPQEAASIMLLVSCEVAAMTKSSAPQLPTPFNTLQNGYANWMIDASAELVSKGYKEESADMAVQGALRRAGMCIGSDGIDTMESVILRAKEIVTIVTSVKWVVEKKAWLKDSGGSNQPAPQQQGLNQPGVESPV